MPNWPITMNTITEGAIIKASDLEGNFTKLKNATNTLHERFSTVTFNANVNVTHEAFSNTSGGALKLSRTLGLGTTEGQGDADGIDDIDGYTCFAVFKVPSFAQALRVRDVTILNTSVFPVATDYTGVADCDLDQDGTGDLIPLEIGLAHSTNLTDWDQNASSMPGTLISRTQFLHSSNQALGYTHTGTSPPTVLTASPNTLVLGGQHIFLYGRGGLLFTVANGIALGECQFRFHVNIMCDAMVPIP